MSKHLAFQKKWKNDWDKGPFVSYNLKYETTNYYASELNNDTD